MEYSKLTISDKQCERNVLGALLNYNSLLTQLAPNTEAFYHPENATLYKAITSIIDEGRTADVVSLSEYNSKHHLGIDLLMLTEVTNGTCLDATYQQNVMRLNELAARRKVYQLSKILEAAGTNEAADLQEVVDEAVEVMISLRQAEQPAEEHRIDLSQQYPELKFLLMQDGIGTFPRGDIQAVKAKSKNGKSFLCAVFIASILGCELFGLRNKENNLKALYIDTEQNQRNTAKLVQRVHTLLGWPTDTNNEAFAAYSLRKMQVKNRLPYIRKAMARHKPDFVVIDGIADLIDNFNDIEQSTGLINTLMRLSAESDCALLCVLHTNKAKEDNGMKGHLGTMLLQKASDIFEIKKENGAFNIEETDCRNEAIEDFSFAIDGHGVPFRGMSAKESKEAYKLGELRKLMERAFEADAEMTYTELYKAVALHGAISDVSAKRKIKEASENGIISVIPNARKYVLS